MIPSAQHLNSNVFAAVQIETTGPFVGFHDVYKVCIMPLDNFYEPVKGLCPLLCMFKPKYEESPWSNRDKRAHSRVAGVNPEMAEPVFRLWFERLALKEGKKLCTITYDWTFQSAFLKSLIGPELFDDMFYPVPRDLKNVATYINDCCNLNVEQIPFPKYGFESICNRLNVIIDKPHDVLNLCRAVPKAYKASLRRMFNGEVL